MDNKFFMKHVRDHRYVKACGDAIGPLIDALKVLYSPESIPNSIDPLSHIQKQPRLPHEVLLAVGGWSGNRRTCSPSNKIEAYDSRTDKWVDISAAMKNVGPKIVLTDVSLLRSKN